MDKPAQLFPCNRFDLTGTRVQQSCYRSWGPREQCGGEIYVTGQALNPANTDHRVGRPGVALISVGVLAFVLCVAAFAMTWVGVGTWAGIVALLSSAAGLAWLTNEGRRQRGSRPLVPVHPPRAADSD